MTGSSLPDRASSVKQYVAMPCVFMWSCGPCLDKHLHDASDAHGDCPLAWCCLLWMNNCRFQPCLTPFPSKLVPAIETQIGCLQIISDTSLWLLR